MRLILICLLFNTPLIAQQYYCNNGSVSFFSEAPIENIEAVNNEVSAIVDSQTGGFAFRLKIEDFTFPNSLMQSILMKVIWRVKNTPYQLSLVQ